MLSNEPFTISVNEGRWPNREYFEVMPDTVLWKDLPKDEYIDWLYEAAQLDEDVSTYLMAMAEAIQEGKKMVRIIVPDRFKDYRGQAVLALIKQALKEQS
jgi:hypothetical protein